MTEVSDVVEVGGGAPVVVDGVGVSLVVSGFTRQLSKDMPIEERRGAIRQILRDSVKMPGKMDVLVGETLYEVHKNKYWKEYEFSDPTGEIRPYASFDEYVEVEVGLKKRKAYYLTSIYEKFAVELGLAPEILRTLDWSKAILLLKVITPDNWSDLLAKTADMTAEQVKALVRSMLGTTSSGDSGDGEDVFDKITFRLSLPQAENVRKALEIAAGMCGSEKGGHQLDLICTAFIADAAGSGLRGGLVQLGQVKQAIERAFAVTIDITGVDEVRYKDLTGPSKDEALVEEPAIAE